VTGHNEQDGQCSLYKKKANAASGSCQPLSLCCTIYKSFAYGAGLQMQYHTESQTNMQRMTHARSHLHLGVKVAHVRGKYLTALSFHCCKESMHLARSSAAGWQCLLMYCGGMECLCLPVQASTASTAQQGSASCSRDLLLCSANYRQTPGACVQGDKRLGPHLRKDTARASRTRRPQLADADRSTANTCY